MQPKSLYNDVPGAELLASLPKKVEHPHRCPDCNVLWQHEGYMCKDLNRKTFVAGQEKPPVPLLCDDCLVARYRKFAGSLP